MSTILVTSMLYVNSLIQQERLHPLYGDYTNLCI